MAASLFNCGILRLAWLPRYPDTWILGYSTWLGYSDLDTRAGLLEFRLETLIAGIDWATQHLDACCAIQLSYRDWLFILKRSYGQY